MTIECIILFSNSQVSCELELKEPKFFTLVKDLALWVAYEATDFFKNNAEEVITAIAEGDFESMGKWTKDAISDTAEDIADGVYNHVNDFVQDYADDVTDVAKETTKKIKKFFDSWSPWLQISQHEDQEPVLVE